MVSPLRVIQPTARAASTPVRHLVVGSRCNLGCEPCAKIPFARQSLRAGADRNGSGPVVITGGEPMLENELLRLMKSWAGPVYLETNGALLHSTENARLLLAAGVRGVRLFLPGWDAESTDRISRVAGTAALQEQAAHNIVRAGLELGFVVPVTEEHSDRLIDFLQRVEELGAARPKGDEPIEVFLSCSVPRSAEPSAELELALGRFALAAIRRSIVARFDGPLAPPPCAFRRPEGFASLFAGPREARDKPSACADCDLDQVCPGPRVVEEARALGSDGRASAALESAAVALRGADQTQNWIRAGDSRRWGRQNFVSIGSEPDLAGGVVHSALLRAFFHCNQDCTFCWVDLEQPRVPDAAMAQAFALMALEQMQVLSITGGEPTLDRRLCAQIRLARALGMNQVTLQTNAVRLARRERAVELAAAGLTRAFVSLHGADASVSEAITRAPETFELTLQGIRNLLDAGVSVGVGIVFTHQNREQARSIVQLVAERLRGADLTLSVAAPVNDRLDVRAITPRYSEIAPVLREATRAAHELGVPYAGLFGQCGVPPCVLDADPICFPELAREHPEWSAANDFVRSPDCPRCRLGRKCPGVRASYAAAYGTEELHAL